MEFQVLYFFPFLKEREHWESGGWWECLPCTPGDLPRRVVEVATEASETAKVNDTSPSSVRAGKNWPLVGTTERIPSYAHICKHKPM